MLSLSPNEVGEQPLWVNTGSEQPVIPLTSIDAVARAKPVAELLAQHGRLTANRHMAYVWAPAEHGELHARFFFGKGAAVIEDPATGSACANLGGWFIATHAPLPLAQRVHQGDAVGRPSLLGLSIDAQKRIFVSGEVIELGQGSIEL
jgi:PhzF family phenazine biosynthesis protein